MSLTLRYSASALALSVNFDAEKALVLRRSKPQLSSLRYARESVFDPDPIRGENHRPEMLLPHQEKAYSDSPGEKSSLDI